jgi:hypothetical protein
MLGLTKEPDLILENVTWGRLRPATDFIWYCTDDIHQRLEEASRDTGILK